MATTIADFIQRWTHSGATERADYQIFLAELRQILEVESPQPTVPDDPKAAITTRA